MSKQVELAVRMTGDAGDAAAALDSVGDAALRMGDDVDRATRTADSATSRMDNVADASDNMASKSSQAAGGLGDLGGALSGLPGPLGAVGAGMEAAAAPVMGLVGAADLLNLATSSTIVVQAKARASAIAHAATSKVVAAATKAWAATQWVLNAALTANPIGLVVVAVIALVAIIVVAYKKSETFRTVVQGVMRAVGIYVGTVVKIVETLVGFVRDKAPAAWDKLKSAAVAAAEWMRDKIGDAFAAVMRPVQAVIDLVQKAIDKINELRGANMDAQGTVTDLGPLAPRTTPRLPASSSQRSSSTTPIDARTIINVDGSGIVDENAVARAVAAVVGRRDLRLGVV